MFEERNLFAALAVMLFAYVLVALLAFSARGAPATLWLRRWWRRLITRRERDPDS